MSRPFLKGHKPWNKGVRTGIQPSNIVPVGTTAINSYGFTLIKKDNTGEWAKDWALKHKVMWELLNGPIPKGHVLLFKDGDKTNINTENIILVSRKDVMKKNTVANLPKDLQDTIHVKGVLTRRINDKEH